MPEQERWSADLADSTLMDPETRKYIDVVAGHGYWWNGDGTSSPGEPFPFELAQSHGIKTWETEICNTAPQCPTDMENGLMWGENIHRYMVNAEVNAWLWWWIMTKVTLDEESLQCFDGTWRKLTWVIGQYSRFVRPGFYRITTDAPKDGVPVLISAYKELHTGNFAIVVLNQGGGTTINVTFNGCSPTKVTPYTTTDAANIDKGSDITVSGGSFSASLSGLSATTFVGTGTPTVDVRKTDGISPVVNDEIVVSGRIMTLPEKLHGRSGDIRIYSMNGSLIHRIKLAGKESSGRIMLPELGTGAYMIQAKTRDGMMSKMNIAR
jgi:glucuronoarabinoxylan endo-1,4-beta-xylanase